MTTRSGGSVHQQPQTTRQLGRSGQRWSGRGSSINTAARVRAVVTSRTLLRTASELTWDRPVGRPPVHPPHVLLIFATLARVARSTVRVEYDLAEPGVWGALREQIIAATDDLGLDLPPPGRTPPGWNHWRWLRDHHLTTDEGLAQLARAFPAASAELATSIGLCRVDRRGSLTHPAPERCIYGDGTQVRPMCIPPTPRIITGPDGSTRLGYLDPRTGEIRQQPTRRHDVDLQPHHGQAGPVLTHGYVAWHARGPEPYQRVVLAVGHIPEPGQEAATAVQLAGDVYRNLGSGVQAVIYDGAFHGVHLEEIMRRYGWLGLAKMPTGNNLVEDQSVLFVRSDGRRARSHPLGVIEHATLAGPCRHTLAAVSGQVVELGLDERGDPVVLDTVTRGPIKRSRRSDGQYYFNAASHIDCPCGPFTAWLSPHPIDSADLARPHHLRLISEADSDFARLHGLRSDAENFHSNLKRTLMVGRAMSLGWRRGLIDIYCYALLSNALTEHRARAER